MFNNPTLGVSKASGVMLGSVSVFHFHRSQNASYTSNEHIDLELEFGGKQRTI